MIPYPYRNLMSNKEIKYMFPEEFKLDTLYKDMYYQCIPELPEIKLEKIEEEYNKYYKKEKNKKYKNPLIFIKN
jgi:5'-3' exonuclease